MEGLYWAFFKLHYMLETPKALNTNYIYIYIYIYDSKNFKDIIMDNQQETSKQQTKQQTKTNPQINKK
jgi:hypothetical protein